MKKKKVGRSLLKILLAVTVVYFLIFILTLQFIQYTYYDNKYNSLINYIYDNPDKTLEELLNYSYGQGFVISRLNSSDMLNEQSTYQLFLENQSLNTRLSNVTLTKDQNQLILLTGGYNFSLYINPNISKDIAALFYIFGIVVLLLLFLLIIMMYRYLNREIIKPLMLVSDYTKKLSNFEKTQYPKLKNNDEINLILSQIILLEQSVEKEIDNRNNVMRAISHEFRTPLAHIGTILYLYENKVDKYGNFIIAKDEINKIIEENKKLVDITLSSFKSENKNIKSELDVAELIVKQLEVHKNLNLEKEINNKVEDFKVFGNVVSLNLIFNNILSNMSKYSQTYIHIYVEKNEIVFVNDFDQTKEMLDNTGNTIIVSLVRSENINMRIKIIGNKYITRLKFK